jgi:phenylacetate-CoA ligase
VSLEPTLERMARRLPDGAMGTVATLHRATRPRFWRAVRQMKRSLLESERWSSDQLLDHQWREVRALLEHAWANVPYYRNNLGAEPGDIRDWRDFRRLPTLSKQDLQEHGEELLARNISPPGRGYTTTGGSTGVPVGFYYDVPDSVVAETAFIALQWARIGYRQGERSAVLRGIPVADGRFWELEPFSAQLRISSYHLAPEQIPAVLDRLRRFSPRYLQVYPSSASLLAGWMLEHGEPPVKSVRAVLCGSENVYDWQREQFASAFDCRVFSWYGLSERVCLAAECEHDRALHIWPQYSVTELVDDDGQVIDAPDRLGEIVGTGLTCRSMPLIRYRTADAASYLEGPCPACGRPYRRFGRIEGRIHEFIVSANGRPVSMTAINMHTSVFDNVAAFRFYQDTPGRVSLRVVPKPSFDRARDEATIRAELGPKLAPDIELTAIEEVEDLPVSPRGKQHFLEQRLPIRIGDVHG